MTPPKDEATSCMKYGHGRSLSYSLLVGFKFAIFQNRVQGRHIPCQGGYPVLETSTNERTCPILLNLQNQRWQWTFFRLKPPYTRGCSRVMLDYQTSWNSLLFAQELHLLHANDLIPPARWLANWRCKNHQTLRIDEYPLAMSCQNSFGKIHHFFHGKINYFYDDFPYLC